jgi:CheY-like chemotaxis protein
MKGKVLVIENEEPWKTYIREFLEEAGFFVEVVENLDDALQKMKNELFHFITIDMQLDTRTTSSKDFEGWKILEEVKKLWIHDRTPTMIITGFEDKYHELKKQKGVEGIFFMSKLGWDPDEFVKCVETAVARYDLRFKDDYRGD